jgi:hypothetical protein
MVEPGGRQRRLAEELEESGLRLEATEAFRAMLIDEIDRALRPAIHERRIPSSGTILEPLADATRWGPGTDLEITRLPLDGQPLPAARRFADGLSSWLLRRTDGRDEWLIFDRPAGSERDLVVLTGALDATIVQRHPAGAVRVVGPFGVLRWEGFGWQHEPPVATWLDAVTACAASGDPDVLGTLLEFAVHDLGSMGIGSLLVYRPADDSGAPGAPAAAGAGVEERLPVPPALSICRPTHLAPLRHALGQIDGAAIFDGAGVLRRLGVRLVPSADAEETVEPFGGTRHTSGRRYSRDDPIATVIAVSEDGPVTVMRNGKVLGRSRPRT